MNFFLRPLIAALLLFSLLQSCTNHKTLFHLVGSDHSGIHFNNKITENDSINPIDLTNIYNGGGVGIGDFNNDGRPDIYFTGNLVSNALYLNKGNLEFEDITQKAGVSGKGRWCRGVAVVDINNDGKQDLYVCASMSASPEKRENLLYVNQGTDKAGVPLFKEMAAAYGLADTTHSTMAAFFDFDNDGDLDMYLVVNEVLANEIPSVFRPKIKDGSHPSTGRLYRNDWDSAAGHPVFTNVTKKAGLTIEGYGHGVNICDINRDGWKDVFVTNDFVSNDLLYINNGNGTFTDKASTYFKHTSANGMGQDIIDINNDGLSDVVELDMNPEDNYRKKMMMGANSYQTYQNSDYYSYQYQYVRNTVQLNEGPRVGAGDSVGDPVFSDVSFLAGLAETDWSWTPVVADFDNDGYRDVIITNGFPKDVTDHDFIAFRKESFSVASKEFTLSQIPQVKLHNYAFRNNGNLSFSNATSAWGLNTPTFSNGAVYADLDNDGDMDMIVNNINDEASVYENTARQQQPAAHFLAVSLKGQSGNRNGLGAWIEIYYEGKKQVYEQNPYRGYLSSVQLNPHFGLGTVTKIDSLLVRWPDGKLSRLAAVAADQTIEVSQSSANERYTWKTPATNAGALFTDVTAVSGINYQHHQKDFIDFNIQKLLPHKFTEYGPALAAGDVDGNGTDDIVVGGNADAPTALLLQQPDGRFLQRSLRSDSTKGGMDMGLALFDADGDGDLDVYIARGGYEAGPNSAVYGDELLVNNGKGLFTPAVKALPQNNTSKSCIRAADFDHDGDLDLFVAGRVEPWNYPKPVSSFIYRNDSKDGVVKFTDVTATVAPALTNIGLVCDAVWSDFDGDGWQDLVLAGEWMPVTFLKNTNGKFTNLTESTGLASQSGWWTSIVPGDFDNDGDIDYVAGNLGLNSFYRADKDHPVRMYAKDFDGNGSYDAVPTLYLPASQTDTVRREYAAHTRDDMTKQLISFKAKFQTYKAYATATFNQMFTPEELKGALVLEANELANAFIRNDGGGKFSLTRLPLPAQVTCLNGMIAEDADGDGNLDLLACGNDYGTEVSVGRYDAGNGLFLKGDGKGGFLPLSILQSGWFVPGNGKAVVRLKSASGKLLMAASQNKGPLKLFQCRRESKTYPLQPFDVSVLLHYRNGKKQRQEIGYGTSFLSQSARFVSINPDVSSIEITEGKGAARVVKF